METAASAVQEYQVSREEVIDSVRDSLDLFGMLAAPEDVALEFPPLFKQLWAMLLKAVVTPRDFSKFAIGLPRGHGKTFVMKLFLLWTILFSNRNFILVVCATVELAENVISDVCDMLDSPNIRQVWGNWRMDMTVDRQHYKKFRFLGRPIIIKAAGAGSAMRGIVVKNKRPDIIICDDAQTKDCAESETESRKFMSWFVGTLMKTKNPTCCTYVYIGNMYRDMEISPGLYSCMLRNLQLNSSWTSFIVGGILADGTALWEELQPLEQLLNELEQDTQLQQEEVFFAEVLNDPAAVSSKTLDLRKIKPFKKEEDTYFLGSFILIDPSSGKKKARTDNQAIGYFEIYEGVPVLRQLRVGKMTPMQTIHECFKICMTHGCACIIAEDVAYQSTLLFWFEHIAEQMGLHGIDFHPINPMGVKKTSRILDFFTAWERQEIMVDESLQGLVLAQATRFNPLKKDNVDDILDICAYAPRILQEFQHSIALSNRSEETTEVNFDAIPYADEFTEFTMVM